MPSSQSARTAHDRPLLEVVWHGWRVLIASAVVCAAIAAFVVSWQSTLYESSTTLLVAQSDESGTPPNTSSTPNVRALLANLEAAASIIEKFHLDQPPDSLTPGELVANRLRVSQMRDTAYVKVTLRLASADTARKALAAFIQVATTLNRQIETDGGTLVTNELLEKRVEEAKRHLDDVGKELFDLRNTVQLERLETEADSSMKRRERLLELDAEIAAEKTRLSQGEKELAGRVRRESAPLPAGGEAAMPPGPRNSPDPVYDALDYAVASSRVRVESLQAEREVVAKQSKSVALSDLYDARRRIDRVELEQRRAEEAYSTAMGRMEDAKKATEARNVRILVVDPPSAPGLPAAPNVWLSAALAGTLGFAGALLALLAFRARAGAREFQLQ